MNTTQKFTDVLTDEPKEQKFSTGSTVESFSMRLGGAAGDGLQSTGLLFGKYINSLGYHFHGVPGNQSAIRGGHIHYSMSVSSRKIHNIDNVLDLLIALNQQSIEAHIEELRPGGILLYNDTGRVKLDDFQEVIKEKSLKVVPVPLTKMARSINPKVLVLANTISMGVVISLLGFDMDGYRKILKDRFEGREKIVAMNMTALKLGIEYGKENIDLPVALDPAPFSPRRNIVVNGNHAIALGAAAAGLKLLAQYPITPASSILSYLSQHAEDFDIVVRQVEDEISAISVALGAGWAGVRSMTATSGPGISLMAENIGLAGITETPVVIVDAQRGGPSTGVPTKAEQSDLLPIINLSHGEFPRAVFAPRTIEEAYTMTVKAFNIAENYQIPVFILSDFNLSERLENVKPFDLTPEIDRGKWLDQEGEYKDYQRYELTEDGISRRLVAPHPDAIHVAVGAEHDEGSFSLAGQSAGLYRARWYKEKMFSKRFKKLKVLAENDMAPPEFYGGEDADITFIGWGAPVVALYDLVDYLNSKGGRKFNVLSFAEMFPLPVEKIRPLLARIKTGIMVEINYTGQLEQLLRLYLDYKPNGHIRHIDGEVLTKTRLLKYLKELEIEAEPGAYSFIRKNPDYNKTEVA